MKGKTTDIRCRAIILYKNRILVVKHTEKAGFYALPGGHLEWGENVQECMIREIYEELGIKPKVGRLLYIRNFIDKNNKQSIEFYFEIINAKDYLKLDDLCGTHSHELFEIRWVGKNDPRMILPEQIQIDLNKGKLLSDIVRFQ
jgi:ADP-ribose pyrophosphatase YjhB (NUDIX family)